MMTDTKKNPGVKDFPVRQISVPIRFIRVPDDWNDPDRKSTKGVLDFYTGGLDITDSETKEDLGHISGTFSGHYQVSMGQFMFWIPGIDMWHLMTEYLDNMPEEEKEALKKEWNEMQAQFQEEKPV